MKKLIFIVLLVLMCCLSTTADQVTLRPAGDMGETQWICAGAECEDWSSLNDQDDETCVYDGIAGHESGYRMDDFTQAAEFDSIQIWMRALYSFGSGGTARIALGVGCIDAEFGENYWCIEADAGICHQGEFPGNAADTITLTSTATDYYVVSLALDPCRNDDWDTLYFNYYGYDHGWHDMLFNLYNVELRTGLPSSSNKVTEIWVKLFWTPAAGRPGGLIQDKDTRGIIEGGIAR